MKDKNGITLQIGQRVKWETSVPFGTHRAGTITDIIYSRDMETTVETRPTLVRVRWDDGESAWLAADSCALLESVSTSTNQDQTAARQTAEITARPPSLPSLR